VLAYDSIATISVGSGGSGSSTVTFSSIPQTYKHLQIRLISKDNRSAALSSQFYFQFNADTGANYSFHAVEGLWYNSASSVSPTAATSQTKIGSIDGTTGNGAGSSFGAAIIDILDYTNTNKYKTARILTGLNVSDFSASGIFSGLWMNTNAITSISLGTALGTQFLQYSSFALYGVKG
jgi:hypothetical protein